MKQKILEKRKTIWVIDDDISILKAIEIILENENYHVVTIKNTKGIKKRLISNIPDLILLDIWMSGKDGHQIAREFKKNNKTKDIPIIIISALSNIQDLARKSGADGYLKKPFNIDDLLKTIKDHT